MLGIDFDSSVMIHNFFRQVNIGNTFRQIKVKKSKRCINKKVYTRIPTKDLTQSLLDLHYSLTNNMLNKITKVN